MRHEGADIQQLKVLPMQLTVRHGSYPDACDRQRSRAKLREQQAALGGPASPQAATRVNPEQASKGKSWTPTRLKYGEGRRASGKQPSHAPAVVHRGSGSGMRTRMSGQRGRSGRVRGRSSQHSLDLPRFSGQFSCYGFSNSWGKSVVVAPVSGAAIFHKFSAGYPQVSSQAADSSCSNCIGLL